MALKKWRKVSEKVVAENPWWKYKVDEYKLPNGEPYEFHYLHDDGGAMIVALDANGKMPLVRQYRPMIDDFELEFPAGALDPNEKAELCALREFEEETGLRAQKIEYVRSFFSSLSRSDQQGRIFIATDLVSGEAKKDETEEVEVVFVTPEELDAMVEKGEIHSAWVLSAWLLTRKRIYELRDAQA